jgi:predicted metal-dependent phosphoesterase TrpH
MTDINFSSESDNGYADLHVHSIFSDGQLRPSQVVDYAAQSNLRAIALTDHDTVDGLEEAIACGSACGVEVIPGIELSATMEDREVHILGYFFDPANTLLKQQIHLYKAERIKRAEKIIKKLNTHGITVNMDSVMTKAGKGAVGRPHIADAIIEAGYAQNTFEAFKEFLGHGALAYQERFSISPEYAIRLIGQAGGLSFLAHPSLNMKQKHIYHIIQAGVNGIECIHPKHSPDATNYFRRLVQQYHLMESGGSDCHARHEAIMIGRFPIPYGWVEKMKSHLLQTTKS